MEILQRLTKTAIKNSNINIHTIINNRELNVIDKNYFDFVLNSKSLIEDLEVLKVGVFLTPYFYSIHNYWYNTVNEIQKEKNLFGGKTRYSYENR